MNAPQAQHQFQPQFQPPVQPPFQPQVQAQQNMGQVRQGRQSAQSPVPRGGFPGPQDFHHQSPQSSELTQWTFKKGKQQDSWKDVEPQQQHVSVDNLRQELDRLQKKGISIQRTLNEIPSDAAYTAVINLVNDENRELWAYDPSMEWKIAAIDLDWKSLNRKLRQLRRIDLILKTEASPRMQADRAVFRSQVPNQGQPYEHNAKMNHNKVPNLGPNQPLSQSQGGHSQGKVQAQGQGHGQGLQSPPSVPPPSNMQSNGSQQIPGPGPGPGPMPPPPPPPPGFPNQQQAQQVPGPGPGPGPGPMPPPPPTPHGFPNQQQAQQKLQQQQKPQQHQQQIPQQQQQQVPQQIPQQVPQQQQQQKPQQQQQSFQQPFQHQQSSSQQGHPIEVLDPHAYKPMKGSLQGKVTREFEPHSHKPQKAKPKNVSAKYPLPLDIDSDISSDASDIRSFSTESSEDDFLRHSRGRSRGASGGKSKGKDRSLPRNLSRGRAFTGHKERSSRSSLDPPPIGVHSGKSSSNNSPTSSAGSLQPQHFNITVNTAPVRENDREHGPERDSDRLRGGDNAQHRMHDRPHNRSRHDRTREYMRSHLERSPPRSPRQSHYHMEKSIPMRPRSRTPSIEHYSDSFSDIDDSSSVLSFADGSVFSAQEPRRSSRGPAEADVGMLHDAHFRSKYPVHPKYPVYRGSTEGAGSRQQPHPDAYRRSKRHSADDYPPPPLHSAGHNRTHVMVHHPEAFHDVEDQDSIASWPQTRGLGRRNSARAPNPFDPAGYRAQRPLPYSEHHPSHPSALYAAPKVVQEPQQISFDVQDVLEEATEVLREKNMNAYNHILQSQQRQPLRRSHTTHARGTSRPADFWANTPYQVEEGYRGGKQKVRLRDGRAAYVDL